MADKIRRLHPLMLVGTGSDVGKSVLCTALCRIFRQDGYRPAPFKAQNMALNSYATPDGLELGRAQAAQAEACGLAPHVDMNPVLLKPNSEHTTQVVLGGKPVGNRDAYDYFRKDGRGELRRLAHEAYDRLAGRYNPVVMEGAGSVSELNLRSGDIVNLPMARHAGADVLLVADIDRGGVFASCYGSVMLQTPEDRALLKGIIVNKFRGDLRLFADGRRMLEELCRVPVLGVVPMLEGIAIDEEDSVQLAGKSRLPVGGKVNVAVVLLRHLSNFTDFGALERDPRINLFYTREASDIEEADIVILPGTKATLDDLLHLRRDGLAAAVLRAYERGKRIVGICGGFQMLGRVVSDPEGVEGSVAELPGLGLLPMDTVMTAEKTTRQVDFLFHGSPCHGYEIHQGRSTAGEPVVELGNCIGTYIHGLFDNKAAVDHLLAGTGAGALTGRTLSHEEFKERQYDKLADHVRRHLDMDRLYNILADD